MEKQVFDQLFRDYYQVLCTNAMRLLPNVAVVEELVQDSFVKLWNRAEQGDGVENAVKWLYRVTRNATLDYLKTDSRRRRREQLYVVSQEENDVDLREDIIRGELLRELYQAIEHLPEPYRQVMALSYREVLPSKVIAARLDITVNAVNQRRAKALMLLRKKFSLPAILLLIVLFF